MSKRYLKNTVRKNLCRTILGRERIVVGLLVFLVSRAAKGEHCVGGGFKHFTLLQRLSETLPRARVVRIAVGGRARSQQKRLGAIKRAIGAGDRFADDGERRD